MPDSHYKQLFENSPDGQSLSALINNKLGWLLYLRNNDGDTGFSSRNPDYSGPKNATIKYRLSNGQYDEYPTSWALPVTEIERAMNYFREHHTLPPFIVWYDDSCKE